MSEKYDYIRFHKVFKSMNWCYWLDTWQDETKMKTCIKLYTFPVQTKRNLLAFGTVLAVDHVCHHLDSKAKKKYIT